MKRTRLKRSAKSRKNSRLKAVSGDVAIKQSIKSFVQSDEYSGSLPNRNFDEWVDSYADEVKAEVAKGVPMQQAVKDLADRMSGYIEDAEGEPEATIIYGDDTEEDQQRISEYTDDTNGDFETKWHDMGGWRGYFDVTSKNWKNVHSDNILSMSADAEELEKFDTEVRKIFKENNIKFARVFTRSSNVFSTGYDLFVQKQDYEKANALTKLLALKYRDPERYNVTAWTGTSPEKASSADKLFAKAANRIMAGESFASVKRDILKGVKA